MIAVLDRAEAAAYIGVATGTLDNWRATNRGPNVLRVGRKVRYRVIDLDAWLAAQVVRMGA